MTDDSNTKAAMILFGATGDLAKRKLYPALYNIYRNSQEFHDFAVIGAARRPWDHETYREHVYAAIQPFVAEGDDVGDFLDRFHYYSIDVNDIQSYLGLKDMAEQLDHQYHLNGNRLFYLAMAPSFFGTVTHNLNDSSLSKTNGWKRLVIEKPFGHDLTSAQQLNQEIRHVFAEEEIYRIDHYLGKEMIQNIQVLRFANPIFEYMWNNRYISNVQITTSEHVGVGERAGYYDKTGALMDMVQNHVLQMVALTAMEPPSRLDTEDIRDEKVKALRSIRPVNADNVHDHIVRAQYTSGTIDDQVVPGYRDEDGVSHTSTTDTYIAGKLYIDNFRWSGVPFYIRTGKRLAEKSTEIVVEFKDSPMTHDFKGSDIRPNLLVIHVQPDEGISLKLNAKKFSTSNETMPVTMDFSSHGLDEYRASDAYERLLYDCIRGDSTNFTRWDEVALSWEYVDSVIKAWNEVNLPVKEYEAGSMGPSEADQLLAKSGHKWWPLNQMN